MTLSARDQGSFLVHNRWPPSNIRKCRSSFSGMEKQVFTPPKTPGIKKCGKWTDDSIVGAQWLKAFAKNRSERLSRPARPFTSLDGVAYWDSFLKAVRRADLWRCAAMWKSGGVYCDVKIVLLGDLEELLLAKKLDVEHRPAMTKLSTPQLVIPLDLAYWTPKEKGDAFSTPSSRRMPFGLRTLVSELCEQIGWAFGLCGHAVLPVCYWCCA